VISLVLIGVPAGEAGYGSVELGAFPDIAIDSYRITGPSMRPG
jgi:hypothetical protein